MDQQRFEVLQKRVAKLERRVMVALAALFLVGAALMVSVVDQRLPIERAYAQRQGGGRPANPFVPWTAPIYFIRDTSTGTICYIIRNFREEPVSVSCSK